MTRQIVRCCVVLLTLTVTFACGDRTPTAPSTASAAAVPEPTASSSPVGLAAPPSSSPRNSEQVVFSGTASMGSTFAGGSSVGFWIWCEAESTNPYAGECNGAMSFAGLRLTRHVEDAAITETGDGIYRIDVTSTRDSSIACTLTNDAAPVNGPNNTVRIECQTPAGSVVADNAVVRVTGPGD